MIAMERKVKQLFLDALQNALAGTTVTWNEGLPDETWHELFELARIHKVLPMIYEAVYSSEAAASVPDLIGQMAAASMQMTILQTIRTENTMRMLKTMDQNGLHPLVVKGLICRRLYPHPDERCSGDEDLYIPDENASDYNRWFLNHGFVLETKEPLDTTFEITYNNPSSGLRIELHKQLFSPESKAYGRMNALFDHSRETCIRSNIDGTAVCTLNETDHLLYLFCHAFKHFLHGGFGIRQVCDILMFSNANHKKIYWALIRKYLETLHAFDFARAVYKIGTRYLLKETAFSTNIETWNITDIDESALLEDIINSGIYGGSTLARRHSSNITLNAASGKSLHSSMLYSAFLPIKEMKCKYPYLQKAPILLPFAWIQRICGYMKEHGRHMDSKTDKITNSLEIGEQRVELMKQYHII